MVVELEKSKSEEQARRLAEEKQREIVKAQSALPQVKQKSELEARIKVAQEALRQLERDGLSYSLSNGKMIQIEDNGFEN